APQAGIRHRDRDVPALRRPPSCDCQHRGALALPRSGPSEQQARDVRTSDQQHERGCAKQQPERRSDVPLTTLNTAVLTPTPSASVTTATRVNPGCLMSVRAARRKSGKSTSIAATILPFAG